MHEYKKRLIKFLYLLCTQIFFFKLTKKHNTSSYNILIKIIVGTSLSKATLNIESNKKLL